MLENDKIGQQLSFTRVQTVEGRKSYAYIYSAAVTDDEAMIYVINLANKKQIDDLAHSFGHLIFKSFKESQPIPWASAPQFFDSILVDKQIPKRVVRFLKVLISGCECHESHDRERVERFSLSVGQVWVAIFLLAFFF